MSERFENERNTIQEQARLRFDLDNPKTPETDNRARHEKMVRFTRAAEAEWFKTQELYASISVRHNNDSDEIRDSWFGGTITVYSPKRDLDWEATQRARENNETERTVYRIVPGYVNGSSWEAGTYQTTVAQVKQEMLHRMKMMEMALEALNHRNQLCLEWDSIENPFEVARRATEELKHYRDAEKFRREQLEQEAKKVSDRKARRERV